MKTDFFFFAILLSICASTLADERQVFQEIVVSNFDSNAPACRVRIPRSSIKCTNESCEIPTPKASSLKSVQLFFSCIPTSSLTGFENSPPDAKVYSIRTANAKGDVLLIDELIPEPAERMRELLFCLYGRNATFCGNAKTLLLKDGESADASGLVIRFVKTMSLIDEHENLSK